VSKGTDSGGHIVFYVWGIVSLIIFVTAFAACVWFRSRSDKKIEYSAVDLAVALTAACLVLIAGGVVDKIHLKGEGIELELAMSKEVKEAGGIVVIDDKLPIDPEFPGGSDSGEIKAREAKPLPVDAAEIKSRGDANEKLEARVRRYVKEHIADKNLSAIMFPVNDVKNATALDFFMKAVFEVPSLKYFVITKKDKTFLGLIPVESLHEWWRRDPAAAANFEEWITDATKVFCFYSVPGFVKESIDESTTKVKALEQMTGPKINYQFLPVLKDGKFVGVADRSRIVASILVDIDKSIVGGGKKQ
jgi:hypothetical protein